MISVLPLVVAIVTAASPAVISSAAAEPPPVYVLRSEAGIVFIVPASLTINPSASATVIELPTDVPPSSKLSSVAVDVTPLIPNVRLIALFHEALN